MSVRVALENARKTTDGLVGELLGGRYLIERKLGEGAMGAVYRARHVKVGRPFAVKVLHRKLLADPKIALRFDREAELAGRLHHPNVIGVVDVGETADGMRYMVMDFAAGADLADGLAEAPMPPGRIIPLVRQLLEGLYHAHEAGLIHRDFKPENIIIERDDHGREVPRIVDFGISILRDGGETADGTGRLTTNGLVLGTPHYMAPEQAVADPIDHRIDLFALGIVVYELLSGRLPFDGAGAEVARANLLLDPPPISQRVPGLEVDPLLEAYARRLMAKNRDKRPANAKQARELLDLIERDRAAAAAALGLPLAVGTRGPLATQPMPAEAVLQPPPAMPPPAARPAGPETTMADPLPWSGEVPPRARRWLIAGGVGIAAAGAVVAIALRSSGGGGEPQPREQKIEMAVAPAPAAEPAPPSQPAPAAAPDPSGPPPVPVSAVERQPAADPAPVRPAADPARPPQEPTRARSTRVSRSASSASRPTRSGSISAAQADAARPDAARPDAARPDAVKPDAVKPDAVKPDAVKPDATGPAPTPPRPSSGDSIYDEWQAVSAEIGALARSRGKAAASGPLARWGLIKIQDAMKLPDVRRKTVAELAEIRKMIADAQKK